MYIKIKSNLMINFDHVVRVLVVAPLTDHENWALQVQYAQPNSCRETIYTGSERRCKDLLHALMTRMEGDDISWRM